MTALQNLNKSTTVATAATPEDSTNESSIISKFTRHVIKQRSGNFPEVKRRNEDAYIYPTVSSNECTNRGKKLLQGSEWVSRRKMNTTLYENRVFYNGVEHKLLSRKKVKLNPTLPENSDDASGTVVNPNDDDDDDDFDLNNIARVEDILKPIYSLADIITHPTIKRTFLNEKVINGLELETTLMIEKAQLSSISYSNLLDVFLGDDPLPYLCDKMQLPDYDHSLQISESDEYVDVNQGVPEHQDVEEEKDNGGEKGEDEEEDVSNNTEVDTSTEDNANINNDTSAAEQAENPTIVKLAMLEPHLSNSNEDSAKIDSQDKIDLQDTVPQPQQSQQQQEEQTEDPFFAVPQYNTSTLLERMNQLQVKGITIDDIENARQLTQIALQRNQEFIKNLTRIRLSLLKAERIRTRLVKWGREYAAIAEEGVTVPNILTAVKRGLISATTNNISKEQDDEVDHDERDTEEEDS